MPNDYESSPVATAEEKTKPDMEEYDPPKKEKKLGQMLCTLIKLCKDQRSELVKLGDETLEHVLGSKDPWENMPSDMGWDVKVMVPRLKAILDPMSASVMAREPRASVKPRDNTNDLLAKTADLAKDLIEKSNREHGLKAHARMAIKESIIYPLSGVLTDYDSERGLPRATWVSIKKLLWDTEGNGMPESMRWTGVEVTIPIETARKRYGVKDGKKIKIDPDSSMLTPKDDTKRKQLVADMDVLVEDDFLRRKTLVWLWWRGDEPNIDDADIDSADNVTGEDDDDGCLPRRNTEFLIDPKSKQILVQRDWPWVLDHDRHPVHLLVPELFPNEVATISTLSPYTHIQNLMHHFYTTAANTFMRTMKKAYVMRGDVLGPGFQDALRSASNMVVHDIDEDIDLSKMEKYFTELPLGGVDEKNFQTIGFFEGLFRDASQSDDFSSGQMASINKATTARITQGRVENRIAVLADQIEDWMHSILKAKLQIALSKMSAEDVAKWMTAERVGEVQMVQTPMGQQAVLRTFWPNLSPREIRAELDLEIAPGSMRKRSPEEDINNLYLFQQNYMAFIRNFNERLAPLGQRVTPDAELRGYNATTIAALDLAGMAEVGRQFVITGADIETVQQAPAPPLGSGLEAQGLQLQEQQQAIDLLGMLRGGQKQTA